MNRTSILRILPALGILVAFAVTPASAQTAVVPLLGTNTATATVHAVIKSGTATASVKAAAQTKMMNLADQEITRRISALNTLSTRVNAMVNLSAAEKTSLSADIQTQIGDMNTLQAQIKTDSSSSTALKSDVQSITKSYRVFALVIPQGDIEAMADRATTIVNDIGTVAAKLQARISAAQAAGANMSAATSALADLNAKTADASTNAQAAVSETSSLQPDNGNQTLIKSNTATLKDARTKLQTAQKDLVAARKDAGIIVKALESVKTSTGLNSSSTTSVTATSSK